MTPEQRRKLLEERAGRTSTTTATAPTQSTQQVSAVQARRDMVAKNRAALSELRPKALPESPLAKFEGQTLSSPKPAGLSTVTRSKGEQLKIDSDKTFREAGERTRDNLRNNFIFGKILFGQSEGEYSGNKTVIDPEVGIVKGMVDSARSRGLTQFLYGNILKSPEQKVNDATGELVRQGYDRSQAVNLANEYVNGNSKNLGETERSQLDTMERTRKLFAVLEVLDLYPVFKSAKLKLDRTYIKDVVTQISQTPTNKEARELLIKAVPALRGSQEVDEIVNVTRTMTDPQKGEAFIRDIVEAGTTPRTSFGDTAAQQVFYKDGVPLIRGGGGATSATGDAVALRDEIRNVLAGEAEQARLSNLDVLSSEIKAGALPRKASPDIPVQLFIDDTVGDATRLRAGDRLATSKEVLEATLEKGKAKMVEIMPKDVVRLADGTFVYAPKGEIGRGIQGTLRAIRESQRAKLLAIETSKKITQAQRKLSEAENATKAIETRQINAKAKADARVKTAEQIAKARQVLETRPEQTKRFIEDTVTNRKEAVAKVRAQAAESVKAVATAKKNVEKIVKTIANTPIAIARANAKARDLIKRTKNMKTIDAKEKAKRITKIRKDRDAEIKRLSKERDKAKVAADKARATLVDTKSKVINKDAEIAKLKKQADESIAQMKADDAVSIAGAKQVVAGAAKAETKAMVTKARQVNKETSTDLASSLQEAYSQASQMFKAADEANRAVKPALTGVTKVIDNLVTQAKEFSDALSFKKAWAEDNMPKDFGGSKLRDNIGVDSVPMSKLKVDPRYMRNGKWTKEGEAFFNLRPNHYEKMTVAEILEKPLLLDDGFGKNVVRDGNHRLIALRGKGYAGDVPVIKTDGSGTKLEDIWQQSKNQTLALPDTVPTSVTSPLKPVKGEGKTVANQIIKGLQEEVEVIKKSYAERGLSLADLPDTHQAIGNTTLIKKAFADMVDDPYKVYSDFVSGAFPEGTTRAAYGLALMKSDFVLMNPSRMDMVARAFFKGNTRIAQELQSIKVFGRMDYLNIVGRFSKQADDLLKARGVNVEAEAKALLKLFDGEIDSVKTVAKSDIIDAIKSITCPVE